ncbi:MAG: EI24 domain-containing protein [Deltaproteobacteria bacterium]|nr:EI24 domain-containing protein [Deltaproteobacteria bacterium]
MSEARPVPAGLPKRLGHGLGLPFRALGHLASTPSLWPLAAAPALLAGAGLALGMIFGWGASHALLAHLWAEPGTTLAHRAWEAVHVTLFATLVLLAALIPPMVLAAPFLDLLSTLVEAGVLGTTEEPWTLRRFARGTLTSVVNALARLLRFGIVQALLFLLGFIPPLAPVIPILSFVWSAIWLSEQALDQTAARHLFTWRDTRDAVRSVRPTGFGMGLVLGGVFLVPLANLFLVPLATVSGALLYGDLVASGRFNRSARSPPAAP